MVLGVCGVRHAGVVWGGVGGVLFFVAACWGVLPVWGCGSCVWWWFENSRACFVLLLCLYVFVSCGLIEGCALLVWWGVVFGRVFDCQ